MVEVPEIGRGASGRAQRECTAHRPGHPLRGSLSTPARLQRDPGRPLLPCSALLSSGTLGASKPQGIGHDAAARAQPPGPANSALPTTGPNALKNCRFLCSTHASARPARSVTACSHQQANEFLHVCAVDPVQGAAVLDRNAGGKSTTYIAAHNSTPLLHHCSSHPSTFACDYCLSPLSTPHRLARLSNSSTSLRAPTLFHLAVSNVDCLSNPLRITYPDRNPSTPPSLSIPHQTPQLHTQARHLCIPRLCFSRIRR